MFNQSLRVALLLLVTLPVNAAHALTDPTRPAAFQGGKVIQQAYQLDSILYAGSRKVAVINGQPLSEGERLQGIKVIAIKKDSVTILSKGKPRTLQLKTASVRREN